MISAKEVEKQLKAVGVSFMFFGRAEVRELRHIMVPGEVIEHCVTGRYEGGYAVLIGTNLRLLLIDKKPFYLTLEDIRYDMIVEVDYLYRLLNASIKVCTPNKTLNFASYKKADLRMLATYVQQRVMMYRQQSFRGDSDSSGMVIQEQPKMFVQNGSGSAPTQTIAQTALDGATRGTSLMPVDKIRQAINPYARSSFTMRQRISRF